MDILVPAITGLLAGVVGSLIAPRVKWRIERKRLLLEARRKLVSDLRSALSVQPFDSRVFAASSAYASLRRFLSKGLVEKIEDGTVRVVLGGGRRSGVNNFAPELLDRVSELEKEWDLI